MATKDKAKLKANQARWRERDPVNAMVVYARSGAKRRGIVFTITAADVGPIPTHCPALGIPLFRTPNGGDSNNPSLDRVDSSKGYIPGNVRVISARANRMKWDATAEELRGVVRYMETHNVV